MFSYPSHPAPSLLLGLAIGDALGVPVEFLSRKQVRANPVTDMSGWGTHDQPPGTWSDDSSLAFCLAEALVEGYNLHAIAQKFIRWKFEAYWTARNEVFDIGITTSNAIEQLARAVPPEEAGGKSESSNGNGSLMRIAPLVFYLKDKPIADRFAITRNVSALTHGHIRSVIACFYFVEYLRKILEGNRPLSAYHALQIEMTDFLNSMQIDALEIQHFNRLLQGEIYKLKEEEIYSSGYVVHTLEASIWCLLTTENFVDAVLKAVNLGDDTDTTGAVTGAIAGLWYGLDDIPSTWLNKLARKADIEKLAKALTKKLNNAA